MNTSECFSKVDNARNNSCTVKRENVEVLTRRFFLC
jgi:hypothetical protein